jgi:hypothetical protein
MKKTLAVFALSLLSPLALADAQVDLNNDVAHIGIGAKPNPRALSFDADLYHHEDGDDYITGGVRASDRMSNLPDVELNIGGFAGYLDATSDITGMFFALSMSARYFVPDLPGLSMALGFDHAPDVVSSGDVDGYDKVSVELAFRAVPNGELMGGYRKVKFEVLENDSTTFDEGVYAGFRFLF